MSERVVTFSCDLGRELVLRTPGRYSMDTAVEILSWLEEDDECRIPDSGWRSASHGNLVEKGIRVALGSVEFSVMCSYSEILSVEFRGARASSWNFVRWFSRSGCLRPVEPDERAEGPRCSTDCD